MTTEIIIYGLICLFVIFKLINLMSLTSIWTQSTTQQTNPGPAPKLFTHQKEVHRCQSCGAHSHNDICEYCGSIHKDNSKVNPELLKVDTVTSYTIKGDMNKYTFIYRVDGDKQEVKQIRGDLGVGIFYIADRLSLTIQGDVNQIYIDEKLLTGKCELRGDLNKILYRTF